MKKISKFLILILEIFSFLQSCQSVVDLRNLLNEQVLNLILQDCDSKKFLDGNKYKVGNSIFAVVCNEISSSEISGISFNSIIVMTSIYDKYFHFVGELISRVVFDKNFSINKILNDLSSKKNSIHLTGEIKNLSFLKLNCLPIQHIEANILKIYMKETVKKNDELFYLIDNFDSKEILYLKNLKLVKKSLHGNQKIIKVFEFIPYDCLDNNYLREIKNEDKQENGFSFSKIFSIFSKKANLHSTNNEETERLLSNEKLKVIKNY